MKFGTTIPNNWGVEDPKEVLALGPLAESMGYDSVWVMDHLFNTGYIRERLEDRPYYHPLATLSYLAATTQRVSLGTSVLVLPYHNPIELAKYTATLDQMSDGRVILGVGVGALTDEFQALGVPMRQRGALTDESIAVMKELWTDFSPRYRSARWDFSDVRFSPKPVQTPHIPLWIGGSSPGALHRTGTVGDGWHPTGIGSYDFALGLNEISAIAKSAGRDAGAITRSVRVEVEANAASWRESLVKRARIPGDDPDAIRAAIDAYQEVGVEHVVLAPNSGDIGRLRDIMARIAEQVIPHFR